MKRTVPLLVTTLLLTGVAHASYHAAAQDWDRRSGWCQTHKLTGGALDIDCRGAATSVTYYWRLPEGEYTTYGWDGQMLRGWPAYTFAFRAGDWLGLRVGTRTHIVLEGVWAT